MNPAPRRNIADGASGGATLVSPHLEGFMQKSSRSRKASPKRVRRTESGKVARAAKSAPSVRQSARQQTSQKPNKQAKLLDLLRRPAGATIAVLSEASGWQQHSVRGFLAGVVRKKLGLELVSAVEADQRVYHIVTTGSKQAL
ncbi:MAG: DUF3489 domain-containing protein [Xanthobacteraceae bacterium]